MENIYINSPNFLATDKEELVKKHIYDWQLSLNLEYDADFKSAKIIRDFVDVICRVMNIDSKWKSRIILIIDEMNNNAIEYGTKQGDKNMMRISVKWNPLERTIEVEVEDRWNGWNPKTAKEMEEIRNEKLKAWFTQYHSIRGRGLFMIISSLVDSLYFKDNPGGWLVVGVIKKI